MGDKGAAASNTWGVAACDEGAVPHFVLNGLLVGPVAPLLDVAQVRVARAEARVEDSHPDTRARVPQTPECLLACARMVARACMCRAWMHCL